MNDIEGIILAAGLSTRAGTHKMMLEIEGKTVIERCIESMYDACSKIIVVGGYKIENIIPLCNKYTKVKLVFNKNFNLGMFSSFKVGLKHISTDKFFFTPGDYPLIKKSTYEIMKNTKGSIIVPEYDSKRGHPVLMESKYIEEILSSLKFNSIRDFLNSKEVTAVSVKDEGILFDIDTAEDYERIRALVR